MHRKILSKGGLTFIEVMVALVILTTGLVAIFKIFISSLDQLNHLTNRLYATTLLDNRIAEIERNLKVYRTLPYELEQTIVVNVGGKDVAFDQQMDLGPVDEFVDIFSLNVTLKWKESNRDVTMSRSAYLSDFYSTN